ncbi:hypothetical protein H4219_000922 [Mycoemilia scoparia]|uniref:Uncharacterized protein n=1 Tax=Mycoemilia scoparia TaxID=417184 RepID=A0A9W8A4R2_9FUNG|nr:hypothetical protein H4219_000922 [Mycoemilia scoparia]
MDGRNPYHNYDYGHYQNDEGKPGVVTITSAKSGGGGGGGSSSSSSGSGGRRNSSGYGQPYHQDHSGGSSSHAGTSYESGWASTSRPTSRRRGRRRDNDLPMRLNENHYIMMHTGANKVIQGVQNSDIDDPASFDQMISAAISIKHTFDQSKADPATLGTGKTASTGLCHECYTTMSSVWRSGPDGHYKSQQKKRHEMEMQEKEAEKAAQADSDDDHGGGNSSYEAYYSHY